MINSNNGSEAHSEPTFKTLLEDQSGFQRLATLLHELAGINMPDTEKNRALMASRLWKLLNRHQLMNYKELLERVGDSTDTIQGEFIDALTTNKTDFFREEKHFEILKDYYTTQAETRNPFRVWCAAASTGEEPYSILFTLLEQRPDLKPEDLKFLATDINLTVLKKASQGVYTPSQLAGLPPYLLAKHFVRISDVKGLKRYMVRNPLRAYCTFAPLNLVQESYPFEKPFDVIFCRNVLIYFERETTRKVIENLSKSLAVGGLLFIGHAEAGSPKPPELETVGISAYRKVRESLP